MSQFTHNEFITVSATYDTITLSQVSYQLNSLSEPGSSSLASAQYFEEMSSIYRNYRVHACQFFITFLTNPGAALSSPGHYRVGYVLSENFNNPFFSLPTLYTNNMENIPNQAAKIVASQVDVNPARPGKTTFTGFVKMNKLFSVRDLASGDPGVFDADTDYLLAATNPTADARLYCYTAPLIGAQGGAIEYVITLKLFGEFFAPIGASIP